MNSYKEGQGLLTSENFKGWTSFKKKTEKLTRGQMPREIEAVIRNIINHVVKRGLL